MVLEVQLACSTIFLATCGVHLPLCVFIPLDHQRLRLETKGLLQIVRLPQRNCLEEALGRMKHILHKR